MTPTKRGLPVPFESALLATAPAAIRYDDTAAWLPGDEQTRQQQGMETSTALSIIDTIAAMRDDSIAVSSTVDSSHQVRMRTVRIYESICDSTAPTLSTGKSDTRDIQ